VGSARVIVTTVIAESQHRQLDELGFLKLPAVVGAAVRERLVSRMEELFAQEGDRAGSEFKQEPGARRLANLVDKDPLFADCIAWPQLLPFVAAVLGERFKLSSLNARSANPGNGIDQPLHADGGSLPDADGFWVCNLLWMLDDFQEDNGALRVIPGTHRAGKLPTEALADPLAPHPQQQLITGRAGDVLVMNAHLWHGGLANRTAHHRRALHVYYCRWDKPQQQYQKRLVRPAVQTQLTPLQHQLCALDDPLNDRLSAAESGRSGFLK
jgi:ectoine hydroxylase-related dioxygenase (phytanoyl-CoA dioxygenase family)